MKNFTQSTINVMIGLYRTVYLYTKIQFTNNLTSKDLRLQNLVYIIFIHVFNFHDTPRLKIFYLLKTSLICYYIYFIGVFINDFDIKYTIGISLTVKINRVDLFFSVYIQLSVSN